MMSELRNRMVQKMRAIAVVLAVASGLHVSAATLTIGEHAALPGCLVRIPVNLSDATGVASASVVINYDPAIVSLTNVTTGGLGQSFTMESKLEEGRVSIALVREEALGSGAGTLFYLNCWVNPGAMPSIAGEFAIADRHLSGLHAVDFNWGGAVIGQSNGILRVVTAAQDSDANNLPDWWEETYFERSTDTNPQADDDGDGQSNYAEFRAGTDPKNSGDLLRITGAQIGPPFQIEFPSVAGKTYRVESSTNLEQWFPLASGIPGTGGFVQVPDGSGVAPRRFYRIKVE